MIKTDQIPDEVWHTAMSTYHKTIRKNPGKAWQQAIAAAINAWPGSTGEWNVLDDRMWITLPVQQEAGDE